MGLEYFPIAMFCTCGDIYKWVDYTMVGYVDYCCADKLSKLEIINMAKELNLQVEGSTFWWMHVDVGTKALVEIKNDMDVLSMA